MDNDKPKEKGMISQQTIEDIWKCQREINAGEKILADIDEIRKRNGFEHDKYAATLRDAFGRVKHFQLGVPCGENSHQLLQVHPQLAEACVRAHIANKKAELEEANERARVELFAGNINITQSDNK